MRTGAEYKVGLITLLAASLVALFTAYVSGFRLASSRYPLYVMFENARGLQPGDPVWMVGKKIGEVKLVDITETHKAQVMVLIERRYRVFKGYGFRIASGGLMQERFVDVIPTPVGKEGPEVLEGATVQGATAPGLSDLLLAGQRLVENLNQTSEQVRTLLGSEELLARVQGSLEGLATAAGAAADLATTLSAMARKSGPATVGILEKTDQTVADLRAIARTFRQGVEQSTALGDLQGTARHIREVSANAERVTAEVARLVSDPQVQGEVRETVSAVHETAVRMRKISSDLEAFSTRLREAAPSVPKVAEKAEQLAGMATQIQERLKPPEIRGHFGVVYSPRAERSFSAGSLDITTGPDSFVRLGVDDIGEESSANVQLGEQQRLGTIRYGLVRSRLGLGFDVPLPRHARLSIDVFNPNDLRADVMADMPLILGGTDWALLGGVRDVGAGNLLVLGARVSK